MRRLLEDVEAVEDGDVAPEAQPLTEGVLVSSKEKEEDELLKNRGDRGATHMFPTEG